MSSDADASTPPATEQAPPPGADPILLGVPSAVIGVLALGLFLLGYAPNGAAGAVIPLFVALGIGLFIAARWAIGLGAGPVAGIFGLFGAFFLSFSLLFVGFVHNWYGTHPADADGASASSALGDTFATFTLCWAAGTTVLVIGALRLPLSVVLVLAFSDLVFIFVWLSFITETFGDLGVLRLLAGFFCLATAVAGSYVFFASLTTALGARPLPLGRAPRS